MTTLSSEIYQEISENNLNYISKVSLWEIATKINIGKLQVPKDFFERLEKSDFLILDLSIEHIKAYQRLPLHHRDPFDRMLISQAMVENMRIATSDEDFKKYSVNLLKN